MPSVLIKHRVADFDIWKAAFDGFADNRRAGGEKSYRIFQPQNDPNKLHLLFEWENLDKAQEFLSSEALKAAMQEAGVTEPPDIVFLDEAATGSV